MRAAAVEEEAGGGSGGGGGLGIGSGGASTGGLGDALSLSQSLGYCALCCWLLLPLLLCSRSGRGEFATLSAPAWLPKENGRIRGGRCGFSWPSDHAIDSGNNWVLLSYLIFVCRLIWSCCARVKGMSEPNKVGYIGLPQVERIRPRISTTPQTSKAPKTVVFNISRKMV